MADGECPPVVVEGDWGTSETKTIRNKLHIYFQSKKKSGGGECRVEAGDGARRAAVFFTSEEDRKRVLARDDHSVTVGSQTVKLTLISTGSVTGDNTTGLKTLVKNSDIGPGGGDVATAAIPPAAATMDVAPLAAALLAAASTDANRLNWDPAPVETNSVVLENVPENMCQDMLLMLIENVSGANENTFTLEMIRDSSRAVVVFNQPQDAETFVKVSQTSEKTKKHGLIARPLVAARSVQVEGLPSTVIKDMLDLYFNKNWVDPDNIVMIPHEQIAIVSFRDPKVVESICVKEDYKIGSIPVKMYPYNEFLGTALYGKRRPAWKIPEPFTENVHRAIWAFLQKKNLFEVIGLQMHSYFCSVDFEKPDVKLSPLSSLMRQKLTAASVDDWTSKAKEAFQTLMSQYAVFECSMNALAWNAAENEIRSFVREEAVMTMDDANQMLMVAGKADDLKHIQAAVENIVLRAMDRIDREINGTSDYLKLSPAMFYILKQVGLQKASLNISSEMKLSYCDETQKLTISGLHSEVCRVKAWILEKNMNMIRKQIALHACLLEFLRSEDPMDMSHDLFTSQGISAIYSIDNKGVLLLGSSDSALVDAETQLTTVMIVETVNVEDQRVLNYQTWSDLNQRLLDTYNTAKKKTVAIQVDSGRRAKVMVAGFVNPVKEVSRSLKEFLVNNAYVQETIRAKSLAVIQFIEKKRNHELIRIAKANDVFVKLEPERCRVLFKGTRTQVQKARPCFEQLINSLCTDNFTVVKPGAKKYFQTQGSLLLLQIMLDSNCAVVLRPEDSEDLEEEEETSEEESESVYCVVQTTRGVLIKVSKGDICNISTDAVVNAANEDLQHIGGLALALLKAAGPKLQTMSDDHIAKNGRPRPGDAVITGAANLPCKYVIHAVGPRFSDSDKTTSVTRLKLAVKESLRQAETVNCSTVALPAISSGVFGFPLELCAETIAKTLREFCDSPHGPRSLTEIHLVDNNGNTVTVLAKAVNKVFLDLGPTLTLPPPGAKNSTAAKSGRRKRHGKNVSLKSSQYVGKGQEKPGREAGNLLSHKPYHSPEEHHRAVRQGGSGIVQQTTAENLKIVLCIGNIEEQTTDVIVNTISDTMNLSQGAVSTGILEAAGPRIQLAVRAEAKSTFLQFGDVIITGGFNLACQKVFHTVCPFWSQGKAEQELTAIVRYCLEKAEDYKMASLAFPAIGTGNLGFPREAVSRILLKEIHFFSLRKSLQYLRKVVIVVHPSDSQTVDCFIREFKGQTTQGRVEPETQEFASYSSPRKPVRQSQPPAATPSRVSSPSLGVYQMQMGELTLRVSSGDITKETSDVIVNSSNSDFNLKTGVSKAILEGAGMNVEQECSKIVNAPGYQPQMMIITSAGLLPCGSIVHIVGQKDPDNIQELVFRVLTVCEEKKWGSVSFPALGTGQGGASPSSVADAMVKAVEDFVKKKQPRFVLSVRIIVFQPNMLTEFHRSVTKRAGEQDKSVFDRIKDTFTSIFSTGGEWSKAESPVLRGEEFEPTVFQLCAQNEKDVLLGKKRIENLILSEQAERTITDLYISQFTQADMDKLKALQRELTVSIRLDRGPEGQESHIRLQGLTRDVLIAESAVRDIIRKVEREENLKNRALMLTALVEWQFQDHSGTMVPFDIYTNLSLEEALEKKQRVTIKIFSKPFKADAVQRTAVSADGFIKLELLRKEIKGQNPEDNAVPAHWGDMKGDIVKLFPLTVGSKEYADVEKEFRKTKLTSAIINIERVQNATLWQNYQLMKKQMEVKNQHKNNERLLFHGTKPDAISFINRQGFDRGYAGQHGAMYGKGSYFAVDPAYSQNYAPQDANKHRHMYLARVLVGDYTLGQSALITPPSKGSTVAVDLYDSVTDNVAQPKIFVVFNDIQAYPEYIITFK